MGRAERRAEVARFRREASRGLVSYLVDHADPRLDGEPLLRNAINFWRTNIAERKPVCIGCKVLFADDGATAAAFLLVTAADDPKACSVSALCERCWRELPEAEVEAVAMRILRKLR